MKSHVTAHCAAQHFSDSAFSENADNICVHSLPGYNDC